MPIYEYQCATCGAVTDIKHGFKETTNEPCPKCGGADLKRLFNPASIVFKGSGFYVTDSRKSEPAAKAEAPKSESKGESKPASGGKSDAAA
ncbi:MAG: zinc ribbon domain-containing protein [Vulcanimicrobiaceae bacterium]